MKLPPINELSAPSQRAQRNALNMAWVVVVGGPICVKKMCKLYCRRNVVEIGLLCSDDFDLADEIIIAIDSLVFLAYS